MKEPKIRFKGFSGEWKSFNFEEVFSPLKNNSLSRADLSESGDIANIHYGDVLIKYGECVDTSVDDLTYIIDHDTAQRLLRNCALQKGDVIFTDAAEDNTVGKCSELICKDNERIVSGLHTIACRPKIKIADRYFGYYLNSPAFHNQLLPHIQGTKISSISRRAINTTSVLYPDDKGEQISLPSFFTSLDAQISASTSRLASLKQMKAASLQAMFPQEGETVPEVRFKGFEGEWNKAVVGKIGYTYSGLSGKSKDDFGTGNAQFITFMNVLNNAQIDTSILDFVEVRISEHQNEVRKGDLFFNTSSETPEEVGMCAVLKEDVNNVYLNSFCFGFRLTDDSVYPSYIAYLMRSNIGRHIMSILAQGATRYNLSKNNFCQTEIPMPCKKEQQSIASFFTSLDRQIALHAKRLEKLKQIKATCLDKMFV